MLEYEGEVLAAPRRLGETISIPWDLEIRGTYAAPLIIDSLSRTSPMFEVEVGAELIFEHIESNHPLAERALIVSMSKAVRIHDCSFLDNHRAGNGDLIAAPLGSVEILRSSFTGNGGAPLAHRPAGPPIIIGQSEFAGNGRGFRERSTQLTMVQSTMTETGGRAVSVEDGGTFQALQCTFSKGSGAFYMDDDSRSFNIDHCTVVGHEAPTAAIYIDDPTKDTSMLNCIIVGNTRFDIESGKPVEANIRGVFVDGGGNFIGGDPLLGPLARHGGLTRTLHPLPGSPAIDSAMPATAATLVDQRGFDRLSGTAPDSGAIESGAVPLTDLDGDGMADAWERRFGIDTGSPQDGEQDTDRDGQKNSAEFVALTNPTDPDSNLSLRIRSTLA